MQEQSGSVDVDRLRSWARAQLRAGGQGAEPREAGTLIAHALGWSEARVLSFGEFELSREQVEHVRDLVSRRAQGEPFAYLTRSCQFYGRDFAVDSRVLIPRPETEHLIEAVLGLSPRPRSILDIGTGSGCLAITLALELGKTRVTATDISISALALASVNRRRFGLGPDRLELIASDLDRGLDVSRFDTIVSNPPYVAHSDDLPTTVVEFEPHLALFAKDKGLGIYERLLGPQTQFVEGQRVILEIGAEQRPAVESIAATRFRTEQVLCDLAGWERVLSLRRN